MDDDPENTYQKNKTKKRIMKKLIAIFYFMVISVFAFSQEVEMAVEMRSSGKIYVVVAVLAVVFIGIVFYLISIDRKISKMEK